MNTTSSRLVRIIAALRLMRIADHECIARACQVEPAVIASVASDHAAESHFDEKQDEVVRGRMSAPFKAPPLVCSSG